MSTRYLRKVYGTNLPLKENQDDISDTDEPIITAKKSKHFNAFNLLNEDSESGEEKEDNDEIKVPSVDSPGSSEDETVKRKKKRKKKKNKSKIQEGQKEELINNDDNEIDEVERSVREVNRLLGEPVPSSSKDTQDKQSQKTTKELILNVQHKYLNPQNELKRICGSKVVQSNNVNKNRARGGGGRTNLRKTWLTNLNDWMPARKSGLSMSVDDKNKDNINNYQSFIFNHSTSYQQIQKQFYAAVESQTPENIVNILNAYPQHVDALLQFADICKVNEDLQMSAEFVERAVHCLECAFHPLFNLTNGNCRLNYKHQTNRALFIALFRHLMFIAGRACYRTSLELSKVLLSLDPINDPTAIILGIDLYALRSREYNWFLQFSELWESEKNLTQLPNFAYSLGLANFNLGNIDKADELLQNALFMFPGVLINLLDKCGVSTDTRLLGHDYFNSQAKATTSPALEKLQDLYVIRTFHLWKEADILPWLERNVHDVMDRIDGGDKYTKFCIDKRKKRYQGLPVNILRHIILSDIKEITISHPGMQNEGTFFSYDPLPPADSINIYPKTLRGTTPQQQPPINRNFWEDLFAPIFSDLGGQINFNGLNINVGNNEEEGEEENLPGEFD